MGSAAMYILLSIGVLTIGWLLFAGWIVYVTIRGVARGIGILTGVVRRPPVATIRCGQFRCGAPNPVSARYCRRCGNALLASTRSREKVAA